MAELSSISKEILKKKNLDKNLSLYINNMMSLYNRFSHIKLAMNYYTFNDVVSETEDEMSQNISEHLSKLNVIIKENVVNNSEEVTRTDSIDVLKNIRKQITDTMEIVTTFVDRFAIFEHILNRIEYKFLDEIFDEDYYDNQFANDIMNFILADRDSVVVNGKIAEVVGQLPMRLTKNKFFELVHDALNLYKGQEKSSLNDFVYMLKTASGAYSPEGFEDNFKDLHEIFNKLSAYNYKEITKEEFDEARKLLDYSIDCVTRISDLYVQLMELINDTLVLLMSKQYAFQDNSEKENCNFVITSVLESDNMEFADQMFDDLNDKFISFEGKQEKIYSLISSNDYAIDDIASSFTNELETFNLTEAFNELKDISKLSSGSNFVNLVEVKDADEAVQEDVDCVFEEYHQTMTELFKSGSQIYNRAVMSRVLSSLPVFFNNVDEIMNYVKTSLSQCSDLAERKACVALIQMLIEDSNA